MSVTFSYDHDGYLTFLSQTSWSKRLLLIPADQSTSMGYDRKTFSGERGVLQWRHPLKSLQLRAVFRILVLQIIRDPLVSCQLLGLTAPTKG